MKLFAGCIFICFLGAVSCLVAPVPVIENQDNVGKVLSNLSPVDLLREFQSLLQQSLECLKDLNPLKAVGEVSDLLRPSDSCQNLLQQLLAACQSLLSKLPNLVSLIQPIAEPIIKAIPAPISI